MDQNFLATLTESVDMSDESEATRWQTDHNDHEYTEALDDVDFADGLAELGIKSARSN